MKINRVLMIAGALALAIPMQTSAGESNLDEDYVYHLCQEAGDLYNISPELIQAMVEAESSYNPYAVSSYGGVGLMQVVPRWHTERIDSVTVGDLYDPYQNIVCGTDYVYELAQEYDDVPLVLMVYNQGDSSALAMYNDGIVSKYAKQIMERAYELEEEHGKHNY